MTSRQDDCLLMRVLFQAPRFLFHALRNVWWRGTSATTIRVPLRVWPTECDLNLHLNNARFLVNMDLVRVLLALRSGEAWARLREKLNPVVVEVEVRYLRPLRLGQAYVLEAGYLGFEGRRLWIRQRFLRAETVCAEARVGLVYLHDGKVVTEETLRAAVERFVTPSAQSL